MFEQTFKNLDDVLWKEAECLSDLDYTEQTSWLLFLKYLDDLEREKAELVGKGYEYTIKHFADLTNKKAGEFYTPRSVVHLMGLITDPHEGESIYDPACGTGGMLIESIDHLKEAGEDFRTLKLLKFRSKSDCSQ